MIRQMIKETIELWCRMRWLKQIDKEIKLRDKCYQKYLRHQNVSAQLMKEYMVREKRSDNNAE